MKKKVNVFGKAVPMFAFVILGLALVSAALIPYWGTITGLVTVSQGLFLDGETYESTITETWEPFTSLESKTFLDAHYLNNTADVDTEVTLDYTCMTTNCDPHVTTEYYTSSMENIIAGADRLVETQNTNGGWLWENPTTGEDASSENTFGVTAQGLLSAYELTGDLDYLNAAKLSGDWLIAHFGGTGIVDNRINAFDIVFLYDLGRISEVEKYTNMANTLLVGTLTQDNYWAHNYGMFCNTSGCTAQDMFNAIDNRRGGQSGIILWDLAPWVKAANLGGETGWANDLKILMEVEYDTNLTSSEDNYIIGLSGIISATGNSDAIDELVAAQHDGFWIEHEGTTTNNVQATAYAVMALMNVNKMESVVNGAEWLVTQQDTSDGSWKNGAGVENTEVTSEVLQTMLLTEELTNPVTVNSGTTVGFVISNYFPKMLVPDTYTITTTVNPAA